VRLTVGVGAVSLLLSACSAGDRDSAGRSKAGIESIRTDLRAGPCHEEIDKTDPNDTPYLVCPGVAGYTLIVRRVDAGRQSIDVVEPGRRVFPLDYQEFVSRYMTTLGSQAEWRVATRAGKQVPIALIVRVQAREDPGDPEKVTHSYLAVAKIAPNQACVTERIPEGAQSDAAARTAADLAPEKPCAQRLPGMTVDGVVVR
jgi:hypothetical protein